MQKEQRLTQEFIKSRIHYDPNTGEFHSLINTRGNPGWTHLSHISARGYHRIRIDGVYFMAHRIAWIYMTGEWPVKVIDHRDLDGTNNKWTNLREASHLQNAHNAKKPRTNSSGIKGIDWMSSRRKWRVRVLFQGVSNYLGLYRDLESAKQAVELKRNELHQEFACHA